MNAHSNGPAVIAPVRQEVVVNAPADRAFAVFTDGFGTWWPKTHTISKVPVARAIIEPRADGRCYDLGTDGSECDWGRVLVWEPPARLVLAWQVDGSWSYEPSVDNASRVTVTFTTLGDKTQITLIHDEFERHLHGGADLANGVRDGWGSALRAFATAAETAAEPAAAHLARATGAGAAFVFMVFHYPTPEHRDELAHSMREMGEYMNGQPGLIGIDPPWWDQENQALVGISRWTSEAAFRAAIQTPPGDVPDTHIPEGERKPRQRFYLAR
jgi:uncharacterized protein YndB with AHSA1/START domain/quinol monooxygenase YgiN